MEYILNCKENGRILCKNETLKPKFHAHRTVSRGESEGYLTNWKISFTM